MGLAGSRFAKVRTMSLRKLTTSPAIPTDGNTAENVEGDEALPPVDTISQANTASPPSTHTEMGDPNSCVIAEQRGSTIEKFQGEDATHYGCKVAIEKHGWRVAVPEALAMYLVEEDPTIPCPKVLDTYFIKGYGQIVMAYIPGRTLDQVCPDLNDSQKQESCEEIWAIIRSIRNTLRPVHLEGLYLCLADGSASDDPLIGYKARLIEDKATKPPVPLRSDTEVRARIHSRYITWGGHTYAKVLPDMLPRSTRSVFTHADIAPRNILADDSGHITGLIDWEMAGWFPDYWEVANIMKPTGSSIGYDWQNCMMQTMPSEFRVDLQGINAARIVLF